MKGEMTLEQVIEDIYAAAMEPGHWFAATERLAAYLDAPSGIAILSGGARRGASVLGHTANTDEKARQAYAQRYYQLDPWAAAYMRIGGRRTFRGEELVDPRQLAESEFYRDHVRHHGIFHCLGAAIPVGSETAMVLAVHRPIDGMPFDLAQFTRLNRLLPHLERAGQMQRLLAAAELHRQATMDVLNRLALGVILLTARGCIAFANHAAERLLQTGEALTARGGRLYIHEPAAASMVQRAVEVACAIHVGRGDEAGGLVQLQRSGRRPLSVLVAPTAPSYPTRLFGDAAVVVLIVDPEQQRRLPLKRLLKLYRLTAAEARLMQALVEGERIEDYADRAHISITTAKTQLRHLFDKTETNRQSDLISLALRDLPAWLGDEMINSG